ncbi:putative disease resistance protein RGA1 isoform X1 [Beta vulgaris subsp. vulgaris]|uniref:putative disease resistance protein RGA1 isoform X1 n=1 Tax=Beta vulgaris subsp. vulgaris TaxID=3555 RepID=UPI002036A752|nr:putative disease resistance protein RGA1 isoform X1 [Beta vulgaris subsp. vulgaris]
MERIAAIFFDDCITEGYFKLSRFDLMSGNALYKLDRENHLISSFISRGSDIVQIEGDSNLNNVSPAVSHVSIMCATLKDSTPFHDLKRLEQLRTLVFLQAHTINFKQIPRDFFLMLKLLRVLDLSRTCLLELPSSIGNMKYLCYLDLSENPIKRLPEAMSCLENLQTLKLKGCLKLSALPKGMRKMTSLRHLDFDVLHQIRSMPQGMGALTNIRTLSAFLVGLEEGCSIRQLKNMNNLSGSFCISRLENVLTKDEAEEVCLSDKSQLQKLELHWSDSQEEGIVRYGEVLSSLQPNTSLEELNISCYGGFELPSWICDPAFSKLVSVTLFECENCLGLPSLGQLPSLKFLSITDFHKLKVIDHNFYGVLGIPGYVAFPKLENLSLENMSNLEEWLVNGSFDFPHLIKLTIKHCPKLYSLRTLSCLSSLENLEISHCTMLASCLDGNLPAGVDTFIVEDCPLISAKFLSDGSQDWPKVAHIPHVWVDHQEMAFGQRSA